MIAHLIFTVCMAWSIPYFSKRNGKLASLNLVSRLLIFIKTFNIVNLTLQICHSLS